MHRFNPDWGTHIPVLIKCLERTDGPVLELGLGISSTPILHALCENRQRQLVSYESDANFAQMFKKYRNGKHEIEYVEDWEQLDLFRITPWSVALIDHKPDARRKEEVKKLAHLTKFIIIHDSEPEHNDLYHYDEIYPLFKHRFDYMKTKVHTTVLSNFHDLDFLHNP